MILETFTLFDYNERWYDQKIHGSEIEQKNRLHIYIF